jgi:2-haloacid dehalogenase
VILFDVNETLSDLAPLAGRFADVGAAPTLAKQWFASVLRDGFALTAAGGQERFSVIAVTVLRTILAGVRLDRDMEAAIEHVMIGFTGLAVHPDVAHGVRALSAAGHRLVTLSNGSASVAEQLLDRAGLRDHFVALLSVEDAGAWKPARAAYEYAGRQCGAAVAEMMLVAVHPWDIDGAGRAGLSTAWIDRAGVPYPTFFTAPTCTVGGLDELPAALAR